MTKSEIANNEIEVFGVKCKKTYLSKSYDLWQGQEKEYPSFDVGIYQWHDGKWQIRIEWFGWSYHNRIHLIDRGDSLEEAKKSVSKAFIGMLDGAKTISGRFM